MRSHKYRPEGRRYACLAAAPKPRRGGRTARLESEPCATIHPMSRLRRLLISGKIFFVTCNLLRTRLPFVGADFACLAEAIRGVRTRRAFLLTGYVFMPDHWHALIVPAENDTLPQVMDAIKVASMRRINSRRAKRGALWQPRYYDEIMRTVKQYKDTPALHALQSSGKRAGVKAGRLAVVEFPLLRWQGENSPGDRSARTALR